MSDRDYQGYQFFKRSVPSRTSAANANAINYALMHDEREQENSQWVLSRMIQAKEIMKEQIAQTRSLIIRMIDQEAADTQNAIDDIKNDMNSQITNSGEGQDRKRKAPQTSPETFRYVGTPKVQKTKRVCPDAPVKHPPLRVERRLDFSTVDIITPLPLATDVESIQPVETTHNAATSEVEKMKVYRDVCRSTNNTVQLSTNFLLSLGGLMELPGSDFGPKFSKRDLEKAKKDKDVFKEEALKLITHLQLFEEVFKEI